VSATPSPQWGPETDPTVIPSLVGRTLPGELRILGRVGEIPEGPLYRARYPSGLEVVLLILRRDRDARRPSDDAVSQLRLQRQLRQASQIKHPNVAAVHEIGETSDGLVYVTMEELAGEPLSKILAVRGAVSVEEALDLCLQAAAGLGAAHDVGVVHGNLSPDTILTIRGEGRARVKLIRFSPVSFSTEQRDNRQVDKPASDYASPERLQGYPPDQKSDVFSLGAVLHHLFTGVPPQESGVGAVPEAFRAVLTQALDPSPAQRFRTTAAFASALEGAGVAWRARKRSHRSLSRSAAGAGLVVSILAVLWQSQSVRAQLAGAAKAVAETVTRAPPANRVGPLATPEKIRRVAPRSRAQASPKQSSDSAPPPSHARVGSSVRPPNPEPDKPQLSPFRRSHPWAAVPGQRFYFRSSCEVALRSPELLYFKSADQARAAGYVPSPVPGCH
jgi:serine/threonine-protein kinase